MKAQTAYKAMQDLIRADYRLSPAAVTVDLSGGRQSGGHAEGDFLVSIEKVLGSIFDDIISGNTGANSLSGMAGNDTMSGGAGAGHN